MIKLVSNFLEGQHAAPINHPPTCANPTPWKITEMKIDYDMWEIKVFIRGEGSMWFRADQCWIGDERELRGLMEEMWKIAKSDG